MGYIIGACGECSCACFMLLQVPACRVLWQFAFTIEIIDYVVNYSATFYLCQEGCISRCYVYILFMYVDVDFLGYPSVGHENNLNGLLLCLSPKKSNCMVGYCFTFWFRYGNQK